MSSDNFNLVLKKISSDIARVQIDSDVLSQWPISSVEAMYYLGPFFVPSVIGSINNWPSDKESLFEKKMFPGKLSNLIFFLLEKNSKKKMGPMHPILVEKIIKTILLIKKFDENNVDYFESFIPDKFSSLPRSGEKDSRKAVFLLDNLTELVNPIFRVFGMEIFADDKTVYRYYYNIGLDFEVLVISPRSNFHADFFEHVFVPEDLLNSSIYKIENNVFSTIETEDLISAVSDRIKSASNSNFDRVYVFESAMKSFGFQIPSSAKDFLASTFPEEILKFYVKTCTLPKEVLSTEIYSVLGGI